MVRGGFWRLAAAAAVVAGAMGFVAGCGPTGDVANDAATPKAQTSTTVKPGKGKADSDGPASKQTGRRELRWHGISAGYDNTNKDEYVHMLALDWRNTGDGDAKASKVLHVEATTPSGKQARVTFDYQTPSTDVADQNQFEPKNPTLKPGETGTVRFYVHMPWEEIDAVPTPKTPMNVTVTDNGGHSFHWTVPLLPIQDGPVTGDGVTNPDGPVTTLPTYDWVN